MENKQTTLTVDNLEEIILLILSNIKKAIGNNGRICFTNDFYWDLSQEDIFDIYKEPNNLTIGSISEDINIILENLNENSLITYDLKRISSIIRAISIERPTLI